MFRLLALILFGGLLLVFPLHLKDYYPGQGAQQSAFLVQPSPYKVLWFEAQDQWSWRQYNSAPYQRCHWDLLSWWGNGYLYYSYTFNACEGTVRETVYDAYNPILFMPEWWNGVEWHIAGQTGVITYTDFVQDCTGTTSYQNTLKQDTWNGQDVIHFTTVQTTVWNTGGSCTGWQPTQWQEDYYFVDSLPVQGGGSYPGLWRSVGGNLAGGDNWDITFEYWQALP